MAIDCAPTLMVAPAELFLTVIGVTVLAETTRLRQMWSLASIRSVR